MSYDFIIIAHIIFTQCVDNMLSNECSNSLIVFFTIGRTNNSHRVEPILASPFFKIAYEISAIVFLARTCVVIDVPCNVEGSPVVVLVFVASSNNTSESLSN